MTTQSDELRDLIGNVKIDDVRLLESFCRTRITAEQSGPSQLLIQHSAATTSSERGRFVVRAFVVVRVVPDAEMSEEPALGVETILFSFTHELTYLTPPDKTYSDEALGQFAQLNGVFNAWPYWRYLVQSFTADMALPRITLPVYRGDLGPRHQHALQITPPQLPSAATQGKPPTREKKTRRNVSRKKR